MSFKNKPLQGNRIYISGDIEEETRKDDKALKSRMKELRKSGKMAFIPWNILRCILYMDEDKPTDPLRTITMDMIRN